MEDDNEPMYETDLAYYEPGGQDFDDHGDGCLGCGDGGSST